VTQRPDVPDEAAATPDRDAPPPARARLSLGDPLPARAAEDRPEAWGEQPESEAARRSFYEAQRPPHHGG
jgi:hypothetical protein